MERIAFLSYKFPKPISSPSIRSSSPSPSPKVLWLCYVDTSLSISSDIELSLFQEFSSKMSRHPEVLWAQRSDKIYLTVALPDAKNVSVKTEPQGLISFSAKGPQGESFDFKLELYGKIVPEGSRVNIGLRNIICSIQKEQKAWWKRLLKSDGKPAPYIKVDWNKWCDEDEEESMKLEFTSDDSDNGLGRGEGDESSDDEGMLYLPDLEKAKRELTTSDK